MDYGSGVDRPKIDNKDQFELKGQFLKELRENTFSGSDNEDANEHIEKVLKIVDLFHVPNITILDSRGVVPTKTAADTKTAIQEMAKYSQKWHNRTSRGRSIETSNRLAAIQAQLNNLGREIKKVNEKVYAAQVGCEQCKGPHYTKDCPQKEEGNALEEAYYTQFGGPFQGGGYRATAPGYYQRNNANPSFQERRQSMEDTLSKFMSESAKRHEENSNLIKEIRASTDAAIRNQGASIKTLEIQIGQMSKVLQERGFGSLPSSTETNPRDQVKSISTTIEADSNSIRHIGSNQYVVSTGQNSTLLYKSRQTTVPFPSRLDNHYCEEEGNYGPKFTEAYGASHINNTIPRKEKDPGSFTLPCFINDFCFDNALVDLGASVSVMPLSTYLNLGLGELAQYRLIVELTDRTVKYLKGIANTLTSRNCLKEIMELDLEARLMEDFRKGEVIENLELGNANLILELMIPSYCDDDKKIHIDFLEDMDAYRDNEMGDIIFGEPFLREVGIKTKRFEGIITLYNGDNEVTYQMVRSHPKFKHHTNEQCNKIPPLLKAYRWMIQQWGGKAIGWGKNYTKNAKERPGLTHAYSVAVATTAVAEAAVVAAQVAAESVRLAELTRYSRNSKEETSAIRIQTALRGYLMGEEWNDNPQLKEEIKAKLLSKYEATTRRERAMAYSFSHQVVHRKAFRYHVQEVAESVKQDFSSIYILMHSLAKSLITATFHCGYLRELHRELK
ncbi:mitochondrial proton/calcium exchanger protein-like protein isoform X1 [Tanacetum coccineum]|uniref:Mitochondrial proton/calcium exchanger protein-like protein isoform X1 n=1 Tax=Tanacetum coccineum TaxID=301880 RepID=A0ABQ5GRR7_9ASTR